MFCRISLPLLKCSPWTDCCSNSYKTLSCFVFNHCFLKMSFNSKSVSQNKCGTNKCGTNKCGKSDRGFPTVYVLSNIRRLSETIKSLSSKICGEELVVKDVDMTEHPHELCTLCKYIHCQPKINAEVVVIDPKVLAKYHACFQRIKWAHCTWAGVEPIFEIMKEKPPYIITRHADEEFSEQIAEYVMGHVIVHEKNLKCLWRSQLNRSWDQMQNYAQSMKNRRLKDLTIGVLGAGNMGQAIAKFFKPHGTTLIGLSRRLKQPSAYGSFDSIETSLKYVLAASDYIVNTLPSTPETAGLLDGNVLDACTKMPVFINVGRSNIITEDTLLMALRRKWLRHVTLDVFEMEPLPINSKLWYRSQFHDVTITPHCAAISEAKNVAKDFLTSLVSYVQNQPLRNVVDWDDKY